MSSRPIIPNAHSTGAGRTRGRIDDALEVAGRLRQRSWETSEGDKRSATEIEADEVGASLKWATAKVERATERGDGDDA